MDSEDLVYQDEWQEILQWITQSEKELKVYSESIEENLTPIERLERLKRGFLIQGKHGKVESFSN